MMDKQLIFSEIESMIFDIETAIKSLANSREYIAEDDYSRAFTHLAEIEIELQTLVEGWRTLNQAFDGKVVTSEISILILSPAS